MGEDGRIWKARGKRQFGKEQAGKETTWEGTWKDEAVGKEALLGQVLYTQKNLNFWEGAGTGNGDASNMQDGAHY